MRCSERLRTAHSRRRTGAPSALLVLACLTISVADAEDLGVIGPVYAIAEPSLLAVIEARLRELKANGGLARLERESEARVKQTVNDPTPVPGIAKATRARRFYVDPSLVVPYPITDAEGRVLVAPGTRVNPLDTVSLSRPLLFIDARDESQIEAAERLIAERRGALKLVLTGGSYLALMRRLKQRVFFDQHGTLTTKLGIQHVPALVTQDDKRLRIDEGL